MSNETFLIKHIAELTVQSRFYAEQLLNTELILEIQKNKLAKIRGEKRPRLNSIEIGDKPVNKRLYLAEPDDEDILKVLENYENAIDNALLVNIQSTSLFLIIFI
jgi:hypothetical protein